MKLEALLLTSLFALCVLLCSLVLTAMLLAHPAPRYAAATPALHAAASTAALAIRSNLCALPSDGVTCLRAD